MLADRLQEGLRAPPMNISGQACGSDNASARSAWRSPPSPGRLVILLLLPLSLGLGGCSLPMPTSAAGVAGVYAFWAAVPIMIVDVEIKQQKEYEAHYRDSDCAAITMVRNTPKTSPIQS